MKLNKKGFTLIELLGVIVIIGLIIAGTTYGLIKLIERSKEEKTNISISSIKEGALVYANEKNNDESYWKKMIREDIKGSYFCVTIEELQNKGLLDKNIDFDSLSKGENPIKKTTYVGIKKDDTSKVNSNPTLLNNAKICNLSSNNCSKEDILYGVCTGNIINEEITSPPAISGGESYTDEIYNIEFTDIKAKEGTTIEIDKKYCYYSKEQSSLGTGTLIEAEDTQNSSGNNICNIPGLEDDTTYYVRACIATKGGSISCSGIIEEEYRKKTKKVQPPSFSLDNKLTINYDTTGIRPNTASYYFTSNTNATSSVSVQECDNNNNCSGSTTTIEGGKTYKSPNKTIDLIYTDSGKPTVNAKTCDETGNCAESNITFNIFKTIFIKNNADKIGGGTSNITKMCLTENSSCNITSPSIERAGYTIVGWNTDSSASTSTWNVGASKSINSSGTYYPITKVNNVYIQFNAQGGTVKSSTTTDAGNVYKWKKDSNGLISRTNANGSTYSSKFFKIAYGSQTDSDGLPNYNYSKYLKITKTGYMAVPEKEWKCISGCTTSNKTFNQDSIYSSSAFCNAKNSNCTVVLGVNWDPAPKDLADKAKKEEGNGNLYGGPYDAWCGHFVIWALKNTTMSNGKTLYSYLTANMTKTQKYAVYHASGLWPAFKGDNKQKGTAFYKGKAYGGTYSPKIGDIVWYQWDNGYCRSNYGRWNGSTMCSDHVEIVTRVSENYIYAVGGNTGEDGLVRERKISKSSEAIIAFGTFY